MLRRIYLDNASTTPVHPQVLDAMVSYMRDDYGNASSIHYFGQRARAAVDKARHQVAALINARPSEIVFTSGGTESNNLALRGLLAKNPWGGREIVISAIEHPAVKEVCAELERQGYVLKLLPANADGIVRIEDVRAAVTDETVLVSVMTANNEIGTLQPVEDIGRLIRERRAAGQKVWFHTDAVQAVGKIVVDVEAIGCDLLSLSGHKIYAPKGVGALYVRRGVRLQSQNTGGRQERGVRGGTEAVPSIVALGAAAEIAARSLAEDGARLSSIRDRLESQILERISRTRLNGGKDKRLPNITNISFLGVEGEALLINLDMKGIAVSTGSACSSGSLEPSPVIRAITDDDEGRARSAVRFSLGMLNEINDVDQVLDALVPSVETLRSLST